MGPTPAAAPQREGPRRAISPLTRRSFDRAGLSHCAATPCNRRARRPRSPFRCNLRIRSFTGPSGRTYTRKEDDFADGAMMRQRRDLLDTMLEAWVDWREECLAVRDTYHRWSSIQPPNGPAEFAAYWNALDREERAASTYANTVRRLGGMIQAEHAHKIGRLAREDLHAAGEHCD